MGFNKTMFSSKTDMWATFKGYFDSLNKVHNYEVDVCATAKNAKCSIYYTEEQDGLKQKWQGSCWCNPPYGRQIGLWMEKDYKSSRWGAFVVCLVPARPDTRWWHDWAVKGDIEFIKGRLKFGDAKNSAPFPSALITYRPPTAPHWGIFPEFDIKHEINIWSKNRIPTMAPWLLPYINNEEISDDHIPLTDDGKENIVVVKIPTY